VCGQDTGAITVADAITDHHHRHRHRRLPSLTPTDIVAITPSVAQIAAASGKVPPHLIGIAQSALL
jgi:hypothetical protein